MRIITSSIFHGILLFHCISFFRSLLSWFCAYGGLSKTITILMAVIAVLLSSLSSWNIVPSQIVRYGNFIHGIFASMGFASPLSIPLCALQYFSRITGSSFARGQSLSTPAICLDIFVCLSLEYLNRITDSSRGLISLTSFLICTFPYESEPEPQGSVKVVVPKFLLHPLSTILTTELVVIEESLSPTHLPKTESDEWQYIDLHRTVQGPFAREQMAAWYKAGFLKDDLRVSRGDSYTFRPIRDFFTDPNVPPFD